MGNHSVGDAIAAGAKGFWFGNGDEPVTKGRALSALDAFAEDFRGADVEFDDHLWPDEPLGRLIGIAFGPWTEEDEKANDDGDRWYEKIDKPFCERYGFC